MFQHPENVAAFEVVERQRIGVGGAGRRVEFGREAVGREPVAVGHDHAALHGVAQFADVAVPRVAFESGDVVGVDRVDATSHFVGELRREDADISGDVAGPLAQRGKVDAEHREAEIEVLAEIPGGDLLFEVAVRGGDQAHVNPCGACFADLDEFAAFEHAEQFGLQFDGHLPDLVEEQRAFVGLLEKALLVLGGARETAGPVAEQFAFEQFARESRAVDRHESPLHPAAGVVDGLREDLLAGSRLAGEQHRSVGDGDLAGQVHGPAQDLRVTDDPVEGVLFGELVLDAGQPPLHFGLFGGPAQQGQDLVVVVAFGDVVEGAVLDGLHAVGDIAVGRQQDHFGGRRGLLDAADHLDAVAVGQLDVAQHHVGVVPAERFHPRSAVRSLGHLVTFQPDDPRHQPPQLLFIVDDQNFRHVVRSFRSFGQR